MSDWLFYGVNVMCKYLVLGSLMMGSLLLATTSDAMLHTPNAYGEEYQRSPPVVSQLTQVIYYRTKGPKPHSDPANVYVDGRYHTSLLPGGFTRFCLKPGEHTLGAFVNDPQYRGKTDGRFAAELRGGRTYYLSVNEQQQLTQPPEAVTHLRGESEVKQTRRQVHAFSRATSVVACVYDRSAAQNPSHYLFSNQQLFKPDQGVVALSTLGMDAINNMVVTLRQQHPLIHSVVLRLSARDSEETARTRGKAIRTALALAAIQEALITTQIVPCNETCLSESESVQILVR
ncbi:MAG: DUF2846 domain-containing protein [Pantoea dispersa]|nr:hypothetical protein [Pantoea dispersa]MBZ6392454.1 DUF2846 domain-containing protein [Pantoea dispersa]